MMDENSTSENIPDLKDIEVKIGLKAPEGLLRWMREEATSLRGDAKLTNAHDSTKETGRHSLDEKIKKLRIEMAYLRSVDVKILHQLLAVHEGIEAVKWLMEERSTLTSHCSSLTSSQYSLGEGPDTSWRGSWSSLQDPNDKLDNISIGSYLDTLADDMDEYCPSSSEPSVICSSTPQVSEATVSARTVGAAGTHARSSTKNSETSAATANGVSAAVTGDSETVTAKPTSPITLSQTKLQGPKRDTSLVWTKTPDLTNKRSLVYKDKPQTQVIKANGVVDKHMGSPRHSSLSPKHKPFTNGKIEMDSTKCKMNGKMHVEYDAHWRWVQSQEDVTFL